MPAQLTYPGVYIEEIPSGVRTITGVATSITAFVGRALRGPVDVDEVVTINSFADFERIFGGLWVESTLGFAVRDFFLNGGSQAVIVRLYHPEKDPEGKPAKEKAKLTLDGISLEAAYPGKWGANLRISFDVDVSEEVAARMGINKDDLFNLTVRDVGTSGSQERIINLSIENNSPRRIDKVLKEESKLIRWAGDWPASKPDIAKIKAAHTAAKNLADAKKTNAQDSTIEAAEKALVEANKELNDPITKAEIKLADAPADIKTEDELNAAKKAFVDSVSDGSDLTKVDDFTPAKAEANKRGLYALEKADLFNILCIPPYLKSGDVDSSLIADAAAYCEKRLAMLLVDSPSTWNDKDKAKEGIVNIGTSSKNAALFFPRIKQQNPLRNNQTEEFVPCGAVAGVFARTDAQRGVWKAPAGLDATLVGAMQLSVSLTDNENGELNPLGINCLRSMPPTGRVIWGSRTLKGDDRLASEWKYIPVRRMALFIEESLYRGTQWVVFEPNDEPLWAQIRLNVGAFMHSLFRQGAFQGSTPKDAYFVKCDKETTTQDDINNGVVNIIVGFAPLKPAEFVVIKLQQMAGQIQT
jgi:phage tail sheath protein FI